MSTEEQKQLYGDFTSDTLRQTLADYMAGLPEEDLPSEGIINTVVFFLRALFYHLSLEHPYRWEGDLHGREDEDATGISIVTEYPVNKEVVDKRPVVLIRIGPRGFAGHHLDQFKHFNVPTYTYTQHDLINGVLTATVISRRGHEARRLAEWVGISFRLLVKFLTFGRFHSIHPAISWSPIQPAGDLVSGPSEFDYKQASASFNYSWGWTGRTSIIRPTAQAKDFRMTIIAYGVSALDGNSPDGGIVNPDSFTQLLEETEE